MTEYRRLDDRGRDALADAAADIIESYRGPHNRRMSSRKEMRWGKHGSLSLSLSRGVWHDHERQVGGDIIRFIEIERGCDFVTALNIAADFVPELRSANHQPRSRPTPKQPVDDDDGDDEKRINDAVQVWIDAGPIAGTIAETYLESRGLDLRDLPAEVFETMRFHSRCPWQLGRRPAIVSLVRDVLTNEPLGIHRIGLTSDGRKVDRPKLLGPTAGGAVKLCGDHITGQLTIGEGLETSLSAVLCGFAPAWCVIDAGHISKFPVLREIDQLTICVDNDAAGKSAAAECRARYIAAGKPTMRTVMSKIAGEDCNDILLRRGRRWPEQEVFEILRRRETT
jgi:hypothetical protein